MPKCKHRRWLYLGRSKSLRGTPSDDYWSFHRSCRNSRRPARYHGQNGTASQSLSMTPSSNSRSNGSCHWHQKRHGQHGSPIHWNCH